jgi:hypothetical protein
MTTNGNGSHENGAREIALPSVTELEMSSGVIVWIRPMSLNDQRLISEKMKKEYPLPRESDFKIPVPEDQRSVPDQTMTDTEAYKEAMGMAGLQQRAFWLRAHMLTCVDFPEGTDTIIARYLPEIERKRKFLDLPADDLEAVIFHSVIQTPADEKLISAAITQTLPVEMSEVISQLRIFRPTSERGIDSAVPQRRKNPRGASVDQGENSVVSSEPTV